MSTFLTKITVKFFSQLSVFVHVVVFFVRRTVFLCSDFAFHYILRINTTQITVNLNAISLPVAVARFPFGNNAIRCVLPVFWMTLCFHVMGGIDRNQRRRVCFVQFARWRHRGRSLPSPTASCYLLFRGRIERSVRCVSMRVCLSESVRTRAFQ